jgi:hypothetical protein
MQSSRRQIKWQLEYLGAANRETEMTTPLDCALMSGNVYENGRSASNQTGVPNGWSRILYVPDQSSGFSAGVFRNDADPDDIVIAYTGTNDKPDLATDFLLARGLPASQLQEAAILYFQVKSAKPKARITFTGHSLGGGLASLMSVFFDRPAIVFNAAPFALSANTGNRNSLLLWADTLPSLGIAVSNQDKATLSAFGPATYGARRTQILGFHVVGEALSSFPFTIYDRIAPPDQTFDPGAGGVLVAGFDLHSISLLAAFRASPSFLMAARQIKPLLNEIFSTDIYGGDSRTTPNIFIDHLIRYQFGVMNQGIPAGKMLDHFASDLAKIASGYSDDQLSLYIGLSDLAIQHYEQASSVSREVFLQVTGGIQFDLTQPLGDVSTDLGNIKGYPLLRSWALQRLTPEETPIVDSFLTTKRNWVVSLGSRALIATSAGNTTDLMLGSKVMDRLDGGLADDVLIGGADRDTLIGGKGDDVLIGGTGNDTYLWNTGDGNDTIVDSDKQGRVILNSGTPLAFAASNFTEVSATVYKSSDGKITLTHNSPWMLITEDGGQIELGADFVDGNFGIHLRMDR